MFSIALRLFIYPCPSPMLLQNPKSGGNVAEKKKKTIWGQLFPGTTSTDHQSSALAASAIAPPATAYEDFLGGGIQSALATTAKDSDGKAIYELPKSRLERYGIYRAMAEDPTIDSALKMHVTEALSPRKDTGEIIAIESIGDEKNPIVLELRNALADILNSNCHFWAYNAALYGSYFARVYGDRGKGITNVRSDFYTHPKNIAAYERGGQIVGYVSTYQQAQAGGLRLLEPWKLIPIRIPLWQTPDVEPLRIDANLFDLSSEDLDNEPIHESQNYGTSLIETAYVPWMDLQDAIVSLNMSRKNASRLERMVGVNTGKLDPRKAAEYLNVVAKQIHNANKADAERSLKRGFVQTVVNHLIPIFGDGRARLDINAIEGTPNIEALADIEFHVKRLGSAVGIDPALLGFGELLSGGLGDGGFFRLSIQAAIKAQMLRKAVSDAAMRLCDIHVAYKYGKVFLPNERPWRIVFNSVSTAMEREEQENMESRATFATMMGQLIQTTDPEFQTVDRPALHNYLWTDVMKVPEEKYAQIFPAKKAEAPQEEGGEEPPEDDAMFESALDRSVNDYLDRLYEGKD